MNSDRKSVKQGQGNHRWTESKRCYYCGISLGQARAKACTVGKRKGHPLYTAWSAMRQRCENPNNPSYARYGGRGIRMCDRWRADFTAFVQDIGLRPGADYSIDRIDNNGNYEPGNVRWATRHEQRMNSSRRLHIIGKHFGRVVVLSEAARGTHRVCQCACGRIFETCANDLRMGKVHSCGCSNIRRFISCLGQRFGKLVVVAEHGVWRTCRCDCGREVRVRGYDLRGGKSQSCGCGRGRKRKA